MGFNISKGLKNQCLGKTAHKTLLSAEYALSNMPIKPGHQLEIYKCQYCKFFHIGHVPGTKPKPYTPQQKS